MTEQDFEAVSAEIEQHKEFLNSISQDIWRTPEICFKEVNAHAVLTNAFEKLGFEVQRHYFLSTAFRAEFSTKTKADAGPTVAVLCEYDALPEIGHACGHNLIAEAGVAAALAVKAAMQADPSLVGKLVVLGTPAEEEGGGKICLIEYGAFEHIDVAMMAHPIAGPVTRSVAASKSLCIKRCNVTYQGKEAHASVYPWEGINALDAAVACYNNISMLRQQMKPDCRIHAIIKKGGTALNVIPGESAMDISVRAPTSGELSNLQSRVETCIFSAASATGCKVLYDFDDKTAYQNLISNQKLVSLYKKFGNRLGIKFADDNSAPGVTRPSGSTDMGNVSHVVPSIHPMFGIGSQAGNHTPAFNQAAGALEAQPPTLAAAKAMAMTVLSLMRSPEAMDEVENLFVADLAKDKLCV